MADEIESFPSIQNMMKSAQAALAAAPMMGAQSARFWQAQDQFLKEFETFSAAWFKRRHVATRSALEAGKQIAEKAGHDPAVMLQVMSDWQTHSMERLNEDAQEYAEMITKCMGALAQNEVEAAEDSVEIAAKAMKQAKSKPV
ncbi:hypothetical protein A8B78_02790 [Jannaschia sp. EhC01]|nr:hypothetical protein A8B78_02790 [Jannaschia sp. EhC01]